jgi:putative membrane protein
MSDLHDPRVLFAAERTQLAWNRTSVSLMAFGFVVERFGLFLNVLGKKGVILMEREISFYVGLTFILLSIVLSFFSIVQHKNVISSLQPAEIPKGYNLWGAAIVNGIVGFLGIVLVLYIYYGFKGL